MSATHERWARLGLVLIVTLCLGFVACSGGQKSTGSPDTTCVPTTCADSGKNCGTMPDGCGATIECGSCSGTDVCGGGNPGSPNVCGQGPCTTSTTCAAQSKNCGPISDGCGATIECGSCTAPARCGGSGVPNVCGVPTGTGGTGGAINTGGSAGAVTGGTGGAGATGGTSTTGGAGGTGGAGTTGGTGGTGGTVDVIPPDRITAWNPGILHDDQLNQPLGTDGLPVRTTVCARPSPGTNTIQSAIDGCAAGQVVQLSAGTYTVSSTIRLTKGVVLRGAGADASGTKIVRTGGGTVIAIGQFPGDQPCTGGTPYNLTADAQKGSLSVSVGANASHFAKGDLATIDVADDSTVQQGDCIYFKRVSGRSVTERVEIASVNTTAGTLTLTSGLNWTFKSNNPYSAQITKATSAVTRWAGVENLYVQGGTNPGYLGQEAGGLEMSNAAYCWVKNVQTDGTIAGMHMALTSTYRCVVRDSYFHHSANYGFGEDCYGIVLRCASADNLVENNISRYMNKPIMFNVTGGGNVIGYNYADNAWATPATWQETPIDCHCSFPHMELMEGNYAPHMGASTTHGNAGYLTYFRNYASSQFASPPVAGSTAAQNGNVTALEFDGGDINMNVVGNVLGSASGTSLGTAAPSSVYKAYNNNASCIFELGVNGSGASDVANTSLWAHGNFDTVNNKVMWEASSSVRTIPDSLYLKSKPSWWPANTPWPWVGSDLTPMVGKLPAKERAP